MPPDNRLQQKDGGIEDVKSRIDDVRQRLQMMRDLREEAKNDNPRVRKDVMPMIDGGIERLERELQELVPGLDRGDAADGAKAGGELRTRQDVLDEMNRLDAENDLFASCFGGKP